MKYVRLLKKLSNGLFIPILIGVVCILIFKNELNTLKYGQVVRYIFFAVCVISIVGILIKDKNEKNN